jgi:nucleoside-diphosphate-sugar epimerase
MKKCFVLGANGFLGSAVARHLNTSGFFVVGADRSVSRPTSILPSDIEVLHLDLHEPGVLDSAIHQECPDLIVNAAGCNLPGWLRDPVEGRRANLELPIIVAAAAQKRGIPLTHVSCKSVYGRQEVAELEETSVPIPETEFGAEILRAEENLHVMASQGLDVRIVRACAVYGPAPARCPSIVNRRFAHLIALLLQHGQVEVVGSRGEDNQEFLYVSDFAEATSIVANAQRPSVEGPWVFNLGSGRLVGSFELSCALNQVFPRSQVLYRTVPSEFVSTYPPLSIRKMAETFGWTPRFDLVQGLRKLTEAAFN